ncbi:MAG: hypothetical protein P1U69_14845 [Parvibaculaceae bacterium]|nr:hypothetical protein [Parvibaculaceae bacterium]HBM87514.1 hypothetical protein [Rhodobiaceae bacterium]|tara:strand:+ start:1242 stop:1664 length:423 start_codon:yes stop_codon:yes gene_type:complete
MVKAERETRHPACTTRFLGAVTIASLMALSTQAGATDADEDGCYATPSGCVDMTGNWSSNGDRFTSRYENNCGGRIVINHCNYRSGKSPDCGQNGLRAGRSTSWSTYEATGKYEAEWIGSLQAGNDWVCVNKSGGWDVGN